MTNENTEVVKSTSKASIVFWVLGIIVIFIGLVSSYIALAISGIVLLPITSTLVKKYLNKDLSNLVRIILAVVLLFLFSMVLGTPNETPKQVENTNTVQTTASFDVPSLVGKNLSELESILGTPDYDIEPTATQIELGAKTWEKSWRKDGYSLMATYNTSNQTVTDLFLGGNSDKAFEEFKDTNNILKAGNLSTDSNLYSVEFVKAVNASGYTGAIVKQK